MLALLDSHFTVGINNRRNKAFVILLLEIFKGSVIDYLTIS